MRGSNIEAATNVALRSHEAVSEDQGRERAGTGPLERAFQEIRANDEIRPRETRDLREWARATGHMLDHDAFTQNWETQNEMGGAEHEVYFNPEDNRWYKRNNMGFHPTILEYFHRLTLHNWLFSEASVRFEGFTSHEGKLFPILSQLHVEAVRGATSKEVGERLARMGFKRIRDEPNAYVNAEGVMVRDLHNENALVNKNGDRIVIDPITKMAPDSKTKRMRAAAKKPK